MIKRLWVTTLLFCSVSLPAAEKAGFTLKWPSEQAQETDPIQRWRAEQKKAAQQALPNLLPEHKSRQPEMFDRVDKTHRQRHKDPSFSSFNSDNGHSGIEFGRNRDWRS